MQDNYYQLYLQSVFELAETIVIKSDYSAQTLNQFQPPGSYDPNDRRTWKYYLNICGEYYPTDQKMIVVSLDTQEPIEFNKANLTSHRATWREYQYGNRYYRELVTKYPEQEQLILGILYPCTMDVAIEADEYSVLGYPTHLIEEYEHTLVEDIDRWTKRFMSRWNNIQYRLTDDLYEASMLAVLYMNLVPLILNLRLERCHTNEVHSYHIKEYLGSHNALDRFYDVMTRKQALYFYRNIRLIQRNIGLTQTYEDLVKNILTERRIPLASYSMTHDIENMGVENKTHQVAFKKTPENPIGAQVYPNFSSTDLLLRREDRLADRNQEVRLDQAEEIEKNFYHSMSNRVKTKVLESSMVDYTDSSIFPMTEILMNEWVHLSALGVYGSYITITNPKTNEVIPLSALDAYIMALYLNTYSLGIELSEIPTARVNRFQMIPTVTAEEIYSIVDHSVMSIDDARELLKYQPELIPLISTEAFYNKCLEIYKASNHQINLVAYEEDYVRRGFMEAMMYRIYGIQDVSLTKGETVLYADWFSDRNIEITDFIDDDIMNHYQSIVNQATGLDLNNTVSVKNTQARMLQMFGELSSYSIQLLADINDSRMIIWNWAAIRTNDLQGWVRGEVGVYPVRVEPMEYDGGIAHEANLDITRLSSFELISSSTKHEFCFPLYNLISLDEASVADVYHFEVPQMTFEPTLSQDEYIDGMVPVPGMEIFAGLTLEQQLRVKDVYGTVIVAPKNNDDENPFERP